jgi:hypothetical protein
VIVKSFPKVPVAVFAYNRPTHTERALQALAACYHREKFVFYFFSDAARDENSLKHVAEVRRILKKHAATFSAEIVEQSANQGVATSIANGVSSLCSSYGRVVVLEDDLVVCPEFLHYMASALQRYEDSPRVMQIGAFTIAPPKRLDFDAFFLPVTTTWGWATWARAWQEFSHTPKGWPETAKDHAWLSLFQINGAVDYVSMLEDCLAGRNDSWGILWWYAVSRCRGQVLYPRNSLVWNHGFDGSGEHCGTSNPLGRQSAPAKGPIFGDSLSLPTETDHRTADLVCLERKLRGQPEGPVAARARLSALLRRILAI